MARLPVTSEVAKAGASMSIGRDERRRAALAMVAPGTALRDGLERIVRGNTGALIVLGYDLVVREICSGGFELDAPFSATRLRELAKMDGAVVLDQAGSRILRAAVQLVPDPRLPTQESGTRHRTAERVARQTGYPGDHRQQVDADYRCLHRQRAVHARGLSGAADARASGARDARAVQAAPRRRDQRTVRARDRGPGDGRRHRRGGSAAGDGQPGDRRDRRLPGGARHRWAAARDAA